MTDHTSSALFATHLIYQNHTAEPLGTPQEGTCCFCGTGGPGQSTKEAINWKYFSDSSAMWADTGHVCEACTYCIGQRELKNGHWIATESDYHSVSTGDLRQAFARIRDGDLEPPMAVHLTDSPIRSSHAYLWTPVSSTTDPLTLDFDRETVRIEWPGFESLLAAVEDLRLHGFTLAEIRSGEPRVGHLSDMGRGAYREADATVDPHRQTALLETALTLSRAADDQHRDDTTQSTQLTTNG